jgi:hypothetical protein
MRTSSKSAAGPPLSHFAGQRPSVLVMQEQSQLHGLPLMLHLGAQDHFALSQLLRPLPRQPPQSPGGPSGGRSRGQVVANRAEGNPDDGWSSTKPLAVILQKGVRPLIYTPHTLTHPFPFSSVPLPFVSLPTSARQSKNPAARVVNSSYNE